MMSPCFLVYIVTQVRLLCIGWLFHSTLSEIFAETKGFGKFLHAWESFLFRTFVGNYGTARVEWAKSWGFDKAGLGWNNDDIKSQLLPSTFGNDNWNRAVEALNGHDPHKVFTNEFLVGLLKTV